MNKILSLIPCGIIKVEDAMKLADYYKKTVDNSYQLSGHHLAIQILQSFESLYALKLEKGHFVCEVDKPKETHVSVADYDVDTDEGMDKWFADLGIDEKGISKYNNWHEAQAKVIFEGFDSIGALEMGHDVYLKNNANFGIVFNSWDGGDNHDATDIWLDNSYSILVRHATIGDLFTEIERYNRTSPTPIELKYTSNILKLLKIEG